MNDYSSYLSANYATVMEKDLPVGGVSFTSPLTSWLCIDPAPTSFQQRIKQLMTEKCCDWQVKVSFLVRRAFVFVSCPFLPRTHISHSTVTWTISKFLHCEIATSESEATLFTPLKKPLHWIMNKSYLKSSHCCLSALNQVFSHCMSTVHQCSKHLQSTAVIVSDEGIFSPSETCGSTYLLYIYFKPLTVFELKEGLLVVGINTCKTKTTSDKGFWITLFRYDFVWRAPSTFKASTPASLAYM